MAVRKDPRHLRKAADRRRTRRLGLKQTVAARNAEPASGPQVDLTEIIVEAILAEAARGDRGFSDKTVTTALRSTLQLQTPESPAAATLANRFHQIDSQEDIDSAKLRKTLQNLLELAKQYHEADRNDAFISYLRVLSE